MQTKIKSSVPIIQKIEVTCNYHKDWDSNLVNIYTEESYPTQPDRKAIGEEITLSFDSQADVEKFIALIRKATKKIK